jgi:hypothetical protein
MTPKPPDILRKSHAHTERKERATAKEELRQEIPDAVEDLVDEDEEQSAAAEKSDHGDELD